MSGYYRKPGPSASHQRRANAAWLRAQIQGLRFTAFLREISRGELIRILDAILDGDEQLRQELQPTPRTET